MTDTPDIDRVKVLELAERVEALAGPCISTDVEIEKLCVPPSSEPKKYIARMYSSSLDAALTLVPEGWDAINIRRYDDGKWDAALAKDDGKMMAQDPSEGYVESDASTPALALTAACLRAMAGRAV